MEKAVGEFTLLEGTPEEYPAHLRLQFAKGELAATDYKALKYVDGELSEEEYAPVRARRAELREKVRAIERELSEGVVR